MKFESYLYSYVHNFWTNWARKSLLVRFWSSLNFLAIFSYITRFMNSLKRNETKRGFTFFCQNGTLRFFTFFSHVGTWNGTSLKKVERTSLDGMDRLMGLESLDEMKIGQRCLRLTKHNIFANAWHDVMNGPTDLEGLWWDGDCYEALRIGLKFTWDSFWCLRLPKYDVFANAWRDMTNGPTDLEGLWWDGDCYEALRIA